MRVHLKGIHTVRSGGKAYHYAWRGGPRLAGEPGSAEFMAAYNAAVAARRRPAEGVFFTLIAEYRGSAEFAKLSAGSQKDYRRYLRMIEDEFGDMPIEALSDLQVRGVFKAWRDGLAKTPRTADLAWAVLARVLSVALDRGRITLNPCLKPGRLHSANRADRVWTEDLIATALASFPEHLAWVLKLALWTGQRQGDLLRLTWSADKGDRLVVRQRKTRRLVNVPIRKTLRSILESIPRRGLVILTSSDEVPWTSSGFRSSWRRACDFADITGVTFHDLRGSTVTRLLEEGATEAEVATITGHSQADIGRMMDLYGSRTFKLAENAVRRLERKEARTKTVKAV